MPDDRQPSRVTFEITPTFERGYFEARVWAGWRSVADGVSGQWNRLEAFGPGSEIIFNAMVGDD